MNTKAKKMTLIINKKDNVGTRETKNTIRISSLWIFITNPRNPFPIQYTGLAQCFSEGPGTRIRQFPCSIWIQVLWF